MNRQSLRVTGILVLLPVLFFALFLPSAGAEPGEALRADPVLSTAFTLLEEGNPFLERYNRLTGENVKARFPLGVPYLWGGSDPAHLFAKEPDYVVLPAYSGSPLYYEAGRKYLYGFDCAGFIRWVLSEARGIGVPPLSELLDGAGPRLWDEGSANLPALGELRVSLEPGDLLVMEHDGAKHAALYAGTLRMYGYTAGEVPELAAFLDYPLVVHSAVNAQVSDRFLEILFHGLPKYHAATVTDGGVCVSLLCAFREDAPLTVHQQNQDTRYFLLPDGTWLTVLPFGVPDRFCWLRY